MTNLRCLVRWHKWQPQRADSGDWFKECTRCGKFKDYAQWFSSNGSTV